VVVAIAAGKQTNEADTTLHHGSIIDAWIGVA
jgi:hypothetical protein